MPSTIQMSHSVSHASVHKGAGGWGVPDQYPGKATYRLTLNLKDLEHQNPRGFRECSHHWFLLCPAYCHESSHFLSSKAAWATFCFAMPVSQMPHCCMEPMSSFVKPLLPHKWQIHPLSPAPSAQAICRPNHAPPTSYPLFSYLPCDDGSANHPYSDGGRAICASRKQLMLKSRGLHCDGITCPGWFQSCCWYYLLL